MAIVTGPDVSSEEAAVYRKVRNRLLPLLFIGYLLCFMDRTIVGVASLQMNESIGLSAAAYGAGAGLFFLTYMLFEPPSNVVMARVGARIWLSRIMVTWGLVTMATALIQGEKSFYLMRLLLGAAEAGYFPGVIFFIALWFPPHLRTKPIALLVLALPIGTVIGAPLGGWLLQWGGPLEGWQWLFVVVGAITVVYGAVMYAMLPADPTQARWLTASERDVVHRNASASFERSPETFKHQLRGIKVFLRRPSLWVMTIVYFVISAVAYGATFFLPLIVSDFSQLSDVQTTWVVSAIWLLSIAVVLFISYGTETSNSPWLWLAVLLLISASGYAALVPSTAALPLFILAGMAIVSLGSAYAGPFWTAVTALLGDPKEAAGAIGLVSALAATGGYFGPQILGVVIENSDGRWQSAPPWAAAALATSAVAILLLRTVTKRRAGATAAHVAG